MNQCVLLNLKETNVSMTHIKSVSKECIIVLNSIHNNIMYRSRRLNLLKENEEEPVLILVLFYITIKLYIKYL